MPYRIQGQVMEDGAPIAALVRLYLRSSGELVAEELSSTSGEFEFVSIPEFGDGVEFYVVAVDPDTGIDYNAIIYDRVVPVLDTSTLPDGGDSVYDDGTYQYHVFTSDGTLTVLGAITVDLLIVGGGGGGGESAVNATGSAGGGGGEVREEFGVSLGAGVYVVTIGAGGVSKQIPDSDTDGDPSSFDSYTAAGGGGGSGLGTGNGTGTNGRDGACGGGATFDKTGGTGSPGYNGGNGATGAPNYGGGGGGGMGAAGANGTSTAGGNGGVGIQSSLSGTPTYYGGGGGGGTYVGGTAGTGGNGGGGAGKSSAGAGTAGTANTGGGGGGGGANAGLGGVGGAGGSGIVVVRYLLA